MQWLVDIVLKLLKPTLGYQYRSPPASPDWEEADVAPHTNWITHDCTGLVPAGTKSILLRVNAKASASGRQIFFTTIDRIHWFAMAQFVTEEANTDQTEDKIIALTDDLKFDTLVSSTVWTHIKITIAGYWLQAQQFHSFVNRGDPAVPDFIQSDLIHDGVWRELDLSAVIPVSTKAIVLCCRVKSASGGSDLRFRTHGNVNTLSVANCGALIANDYYYYDKIVPTNGLQSIDYCSRLYSAPVSDVTVKGWWF